MFKKKIFLYFIYKWKSNKLYIIIKYFQINKLVEI